MRAAPSRAFALLLCVVALACDKSPPPQRLGPVSLVVPQGFAESTSLEKKVADNEQASPGAGRETRVWREETTKVVLSLTVSKLPHQPEWSAYPVREALNEIVNQAIQAGERAGLQTVRGERRQEASLLRYELDSKMSQAGKTIFTFSRAAMWLQADGTLVNANAVCTSDEAHQARCSELLGTLKIEAPAGARAMDGGA
jgi:hypothetical protein